MKGLHKQTFNPKADPMSWIKEDEVARTRKEEIKATTMIILRLIDYMESHQMSQSDLARKRGVTPQYVNKLLHGQETSFRIETAVEYGKKLGIKLIEIPQREDYGVKVSPGSVVHFRLAAGNPEAGCVIYSSSRSSILRFNKRQTWKQDQLAIA